jgi:hypothetical protein
MLKTSLVNFYETPEDKNIIGDIFNQNDLIRELEAQNNEKYKKLKEVNSSYNGLCDLICNLALLKDLLKQDIYSNFNNVLTLDQLLEVQNSHLIEVLGLFKIFLAIVFQYYIYNIFNWYDQVFNLIIKNEQGKFELNKAFLIEKFNKLNLDLYIKVEVFNSSSDGHSLLIKKVSSTEFKFFDPNDIENSSCNAEELVNKLNKQLERYSNIAFLNGNSFLANMS